MIFPLAPRDCFRWAGVRASHGVRGGKYYFECTVSGSGLCRVGWSTKAAALELGKDGHGYGYGGTGKKSTGNTYVDYGAKYGNGDTIGCLLDVSVGRVYFFKNGEALGEAFALCEPDCGAVLFPAVLVKNATVTLNFGACPFRFPLPSTGSLVSGPEEDVVSGSSAVFHFQDSAEKHKPLSLVLLPAKDLAEQVYMSLKSLSRHVCSPPVQSVLLIGGGNDKAAKVFWVVIMCRSLLCLSSLDVVIFRVSRASCGMGWTWWWVPPRRCGTSCSRASSTSAWCAFSFWMKVSVFCCLLCYTSCVADGLLLHF